LPPPRTHHEISTTLTFTRNLVDVRESSPDMMSATTSVSAVRVPDCVKNIPVQEMNEHVYTVLSMHWNTRYLVEMFSCN